MGGLFVFFITKATTPELPTANSPILFYANQSRHDLKLIFCEAIHQAQQSIHATFYGITDRDVIRALAKQAKLGKDLTVEYDPTASLSLGKHFPSSATITPRRSKGLMHRKILIIDHSILYLGSANLTLPSLHHHGNFVMGLYSPSFAEFLTHPSSTHYVQALDSQELHCFLLPEKKQQALHHLLSLIDNAKKSVRVAMFTFTHPLLIDALIRAWQRGIDVAVVVDYYSGRGASKKAVARLTSEDVPITFSRGQELLHHKWAIIDDTTFAMGSANWTKAAFVKNEDFLLSLSPLTSDQIQFLNRLWRVLELESSSQ